MKIANLIAATATVAATAFGIGVAVPAAAQDALNFGIISTESSQNLKSQWVPFLEAMERQTGLTVKPFFASDYAGIIEGMRFGKVQIAWYGNKSAMEAVDRSNGEVFVQSTDPEGAQGYHSHIVAHKDSPINNVGDMLKNAANLTFSNGDPNSTSGFLVPGYYVFAVNGVDDPKKIFKRTVSANHETNAMAVANRQVDVGTTNSEVLPRIAERQPDKFAQIKVIWTSPLIPSDPIVWRKDLAQDVKAKLKTFFLTYGTATPDKSADALKQEREVLATLKWGPFRESNDDQLLPIRQLELFKAKTRLEADTALPEAEKTAKLAEINARLAELQTKIAAK